MGKVPKERPPPERRTHLRSPIVVREARVLAGMEVFFGYAMDISRGGIFVATSAPHKRSIGEIVEIQFALPGGDRRFHCRARVAWVQPYRSGTFETPGFGLQFVDLREEDADFLEAWVRSRPE
jgi:uncharacterized protein (TIGR02266 family)